MSLLMNQIVLNATRMAGEPPLILPAKTIRFQFSNENYTPRTNSSTSGRTAGTSMKGTWTRVSTSPNVWDWYYNNSNWAGSSSSKGLFQLSYTLHNTYISILGANLTGVTTTKWMFAPTTYTGSYIPGTYKCDGLTSVHSITNSSSVTDMGYMFYQCNKLASVQSFDTSNATALNSLFYGCTSLTSAPMLNTGNVINASHMFRDCSSLTSVPLYDTSKVTDMAHIFRGCTSLTSVPLFDTGRVSTINSMFYGCSSLTSVPSFNTSSATNVSHMFRDCSSLEYVPLLNTSNAIDMNNMFRQCSSLKLIPLFNTSRVTDMSFMFYSCRKVESGALALYQQASSQNTPPSSYANCFYYCGANTTTGAAELAQIPASWK